MAAPNGSQTPPDSKRPIDLRRPQSQQNEQDGIIADATAAASDDTLTFEERIAATIRATDLANDTSLADEAAFLQMFATS